VTSLSKVANFTGGFLDRAIFTSNFNLGCV